MKKQKSLDERLKAQAYELEENLQDLRESLAETEGQLADLDRRREDGESISQNAFYHTVQHIRLLESGIERYRVQAEKFYKRFPEYRLKP